MAVGTGAFEAIIATGIKKVSQAVLGVASTKAKEIAINKYKKAVGPRKLNKFAANCNLYLYSRTLYSTHSNVYIDDYYVPLTISPMGGEEREIEVVDLKFSSPGITNIIGKAGQGKSTILKKIFKNELCDGEKFPIFFELKNFKSDSLTKQISEWFKKKDLDIDEVVVKFLLKENKLALFLDAFDEINPDLHDDAVEEIESFSIAYPNLAIIITTRPDTQIINQLCVNNYKLNDINEIQIRDIFSNISGDDERVSSAMLELSKNNRVLAVINTPILAVLLFITYKVWTEIPNDLSSFYSKIFGTLLRWHDSLKSGKKIVRVSLPINDNKVEEIFERICFKSMTKSIADFSESELQCIIVEVLREKNIDIDLSADYARFIKDTTGILCSDGFDRVVFIHKSFQEYYSASYISKLSDVKKSKFYKTVSNNKKRNSGYVNTLRFLANIDYKVFVEEFYIPNFKEFYNVNVVPDKITDGMIKPIFKEYASGFLSSLNGAFLDVQAALEVDDLNIFNKLYYYELRLLITLAVLKGTIGEVTKDRVKMVDLDEADLDRIVDESIDFWTPTVSKNHEELMELYAQALLLEDEDFDDI
jgi:hypothetical protein